MLKYEIIDHLVIVSMSVHRPKLFGFGSYRESGHLWSCSYLKTLSR